MPQSRLRIGAPRLFHPAGIFQSGEAVVFIGGNDNGHTPPIPGNGNRLLSDALQDFAQSILGIGSGNGFHG